MIAPSLTTKRALPAIDRRAWLIIMAIGFFGVLVMKEVSLPAPVVLAFGILCLFALLAVGLQSPQIPLYVLVAYLPFSKVRVGDFGTQATALNLTNILCLWLFAAHVLRQMAKNQPIFAPTPLNRMVIAFALLGAAALLRAGWAYGSWYIWDSVTSLKRWLTPMLLYFLTLWVVRDKRTVKTTAVLIMVATATVALMAIRDYSYVAESNFEKSRIGGTMGHSNTLAAFFVYYMFLFLGFIFTYPRKGRVWWLLAPFLACFRGIMVTFSRGGYLAFAVAGLAACWFRNKFLLIVVMALGIFALANPWILPAVIRYRMGRTVQENRLTYEDSDLTQNLEASAASRVEIWKGAIKIIKEHPWWGVGYDTFPHFILNYTQGKVGYMDAHNSYLLIAAEMGIPTLIVFLFVLGGVCYYTYWLYRHTQDRAIKEIG